MNHAWLSLLVLISAISVPGVVQGQTRDGEGWSTCAGLGAGAAVVRIRLVPETAGLDLSRGVQLVQGQERACRGLTTEGGSFEFRGIPRGSYELTFGWLGLQPLPPLAVEVGAEPVI